MRGPEGLGRVDPAALDAPGRGLDRQGIRPGLRKPLGPDRAAASPRTRISQARSHLAQARSENAEGVHCELRKPDEFHGRRRSRDVCGRGASNPCGAARGLLGAFSADNVEACDKAGVTPVIAMGRQPHHPAAQRALRAGAWRRGRTDADRGDGLSTEDAGRPGALRGCASRPRNRCSASSSGCSDSVNFHCAGSRKCAANGVW